MVGADVAALGEALMADVAFKGLFACVAALMGLYRKVLVYVDLFQGKI